MKLILRISAAVLCLALSLPSPAFAMHTLEPVESAPLLTKLTAGLEEKTGAPSAPVEGQRVLLFTLKDDYGLAILKELRNTPHHVVGIVTVPSATGLISWASNHGIPLWNAQDYFDSLFVKERMKDSAYQAKIARLAQALQKLQPDVGIAATFFHIPDPLLAVARKKFFNIHPSKLPQYRGGFTIPALILNGEKELYVTLHEAVAGTDAGPIVGQSGPMPIADGEDAKALQAKAIPPAVQLVARALDALGSGTYSAVPQGPAQPPYAWGIRTREKRGPDGSVVGTTNEGLLPKLAVDWTAVTRDELMRRVRAFQFEQSTIVPFTNYQGQLLFLTKAEPAASSSQEGQPGQILRIEDDGGVVVQVSDGAVKVWFGRFPSRFLRVGGILRTTEKVSRVTGLPRSDATGLEEKIQQATRALEIAVSTVPWNNRPLFLSRVKAGLRAVEAIPFDYWSSLSEKFETVKQAFGDLHPKSPQIQDLANLWKYLREFQKGWLVLAVQETNVPTHRRSREPASGTHRLEQLKNELDRMPKEQSRLHYLRRVAGFGTPHDLEKAAGVSWATVSRMEAGTRGMGPSVRRKVKAYLEKNTGLSLTLAFRYLKLPLDQSVNVLSSAQERFSFLMNDLLGWSYGGLIRQANALRDSFDRPILLAERIIPFERFRPGKRRLIRGALERGLSEQMGSQVRIDGHLRVVTKSVADRLRALPGPEARFSFLLEEELIWSKNELLRRAGIQSHKKIKPAPIQNRMAIEKQAQFLRALETGLAARGEPLTLTSDFLPQAGLEEPAFVSRDSERSAQLRSLLTGNWLTSARVNQFIQAVLGPFQQESVPPLGLLKPGAVYSHTFVRMGQKDTQEAVRRFGLDLIGRSRVDERTRAAATRVLEVFLSRPDERVVSGQRLQDLSDNEAIEMVLELLRVATGVQDPYARLKKEYNQNALHYLTVMQHAVRDSDHPLKTAISLGIIGNAIDFADAEQREKLQRGEFSIPAEIRRAENLRFLVDKRDQFAWALKKSQRKELLFLVDNAGEIIFDLPLIRLLLHGGWEITVAGKSLPHANDMLATELEELFQKRRVLKYLGRTQVDERLKVIASGTAMTGLDLRRATPELVQAWRRASIIYAKGQGMIETLRYNNLSKDVFHAVMVKNPAHFREVDAQGLPLLLNRGDVLFLHTIPAGLEETPLAEVVIQGSALQRPREPYDWRMAESAAISDFFKQRLGDYLPHFPARPGIPAGQMVRETIVPKILNYAVESARSFWGPHVSSAQVSLRAFLKEGSLWIQVQDNARELPQEAFLRPLREAERVNKGFLLRPLSSEEIFALAYELKHLGWTLEGANREDQVGVVWTLQIPLQERFISGLEEGRTRRAAAQDQVEAMVQELTRSGFTYQVVDLDLVREFPQLAGLEELSQGRIVIDRSGGPEETGRLVADLIARSPDVTRVDYYASPTSRRASWFYQKARIARIAVESVVPAQMFLWLRQILDHLRGPADEPLNDLRLQQVASGLEELA